MLLPNIVSTKKMWILIRNKYFDMIKSYILSETNDWTKVYLEFEFTHRVRLQQGQQNA